MVSTTGVSVDYSSSTMAWADTPAPLLKREDCKRTKHDSDFSRWQVLVGPNDWEDYSMGKEGAERYRTANLPRFSSPGLYELGIAVRKTSLGREIAKLDTDGIVVMYLGQADNVRTRLQCYGRSGSHLGGGLPYDLNGPKTLPLQRGPRVFDEILSRGYPIVYRWAPMQNKRDAQKTEMELLRTFDYAWNTICNGARRHDDILQKLDKINSHKTKSQNITGRLLDLWQKKVGIRIKANKLPFQDEGSNHTGDESFNFLPRIFKISRSQPRLVSDINGAHEVNTASICGVAVSNGQVCRKPPVEGRKRCAEHKGMRINRSVPKSAGGKTIENYPSEPIILGAREVSRRAENFPQLENSTSICGFILNDGSVCRTQPVRGRKRCEEHKGRRISGSSSVPTKEFNSVFIYGTAFGCGNRNAFDCRQDFSSYQRGGMQSQSFSERCGFSNDRGGSSCGVIIGDGLYCSRQPVKGRVRCEEHKGMRIHELITRRKR